MILLKTSISSVADLETNVEDNFTLFSKFLDPLPNGKRLRLRRRHCLRHKVKCRYVITFITKRHGVFCIEKVIMSNQHLLRHSHTSRINSFLSQSNRLNFEIKV